MKQPDAVPAQVGPYIPQQLLAMGAQASVWLASGPGGSEVALKIARGEDGRRGLAREAALLGTVTHPNLARLLGADPGGDWIALEPVEGLPFDQWARDRDHAAIVATTQKLVDTLEFLHKSDIVHGDVNPSNVLVDAEGEPHLIDLGIATRPGEKVEGFRGTLGYAAPELLNGRPPSAATDFYGLGALLYTALTARTPFVAPDPAALTYLPLVSLPAPPSAFRPELPASLSQLVLALLARDPERRPADPRRMKEALQKSITGLPAPPVLGMLEEREELLRAVVGAADGEPRVVALYGAAGSGRRTLIAEAVEYARREGLPYLKGTDPQGALEQLREANRPAVLVMKAASKGARQLAEIVLKDGLRCLLLLHADRPLPGLQGAIQLTPAPLSPQDAARLARLWNADPDLAETWWRQSMGLPIAIVGRIRAFRRSRGLTQTHSSQLPSEAKRIVDFLRNQPKMRCELTHLAAELQMQEHTLLDHCEVLFAEDLIEPADDGASLAIVQARSVT